MTNQLAVQRVGLVTFDRDKIELIKRTVAKGATDDELELFLHQCKRMGLDPLAKQIYFRKSRSKNGDQMTIITGIDGYRLVADRTGLYAGSDDPVFDNEDSPKKATVTVYKMIGGQRCPFTATARWEQYYPGDTQGFMWRKMPHLMLGKCAEGLALRKAFPAELAGAYVKEEMDQAGAEVVEAETEYLPEQTVQIEPETYQATQVQKARLWMLAKRHGITDVNVVKKLSEACTGVDMANLEAAVKEWKAEPRP